MAITWEATITVINMANNEISISAIRTDTADGSTMEYEVAKATIDPVTMANNVHILDEIWIKHQARLTKEAGEASFVSALETLAKSNLEARE
jgi:hypothetical protein